MSVIAAPAMGDCHYPPSEEKFCKYSYSSWCPTCERNSPRRRSRSETTTECRRRCKEMKSLSPKKYARSHEYENMDLEWCEPPRENYKIRSSQLCELPTSYISNNCQTTKLLPTEYVKNHDSTFKMKQEDFLEVFKPKHLNGYVKKPQKESPQRSPYTSVYDTRLSFDTSTYFDKVRDASTLHERYIKEIESVRERIALWKGATKRAENESRNQKAVPVHEGHKFAENDRLTAFKSTNTNDIIMISQSEICPRPKKIAVKTKKVTLNRMRKVKLPSSRLSTSNTPVQEFTERYVLQLFS